MMNKHHTPTSSIATRLIGSLGAMLAIALSAPALAAGDGKGGHDHAHDHAHAHAPLHGGVVSEVKDMDYELVAKPALVQLYLRDHGKPADVSKASAKLTLLTGTEKQDVLLQPAGDRLEAAGSFKIAPGTKAVAVVTLAGKASTVRFSLK